MSAQKITKTFLWKYYRGNVEHKTPLPLLRDNHLLNIHHKLRETCSWSNIFLKTHDRKEVETDEIKKHEDHIEWCNIWIPRFEDEVQKRKLKEIPLAGDRLSLQKFLKSGDFFDTLMKDINFVKKNGPSTL